MEGSSKGPATGASNSTFKSIAKSPTFRILIPFVITLQVGWYFIFRDRTVFDEERRIFVFKERSKD